MPGKPIAGLPSGNSGKGLPALTKRNIRTFPRATLHLHDELPRIGSGRRRVLVRKLTPKYAWLVYLGEPIRVLRKTFETVKIEG